MVEYAPVLIITLCRIKHLKCCIESLSHNALAKDTVLYIALDYPGKKSHWQGYNEILKYIQYINGFREVIVLKRDINYGAEANSRIAKETIFQRFDRLIFSEDDNEFSPNFLEYMNNGLKNYEDDESIFAICGYNFPIKIPVDYKYNHYFAQSFSAWGYGVLRKNWNKINLRNESTYKELKGKLTIFNIHILKLQTIYNNLKSIESGSIIGDTNIGLYIRKNHKYCVFPKLSKVRNHGHDGSGEHCSISKIYVAQGIDDSCKFIFDSIKNKRNRIIEKNLIKYLDISLRLKIIAVYKYIIFLCSFKNFK